MYSPHKHISCFSFSLSTYALVRSIFSVNVIMTLGILMYIEFFFKFSSLCNTSVSSRFFPLLVLVSLFHVRFSSDICGLWVSNQIYMGYTKKITRECWVCGQGCFIGGTPACNFRLSIFRAFLLDYLYHMKRNSPISCLECTNWELVFWDPSWLGKKKKKKQWISISRDSETCT